MELNLFTHLYGGPLGTFAPECNALYWLGGGWGLTLLVPFAMASRTRRLGAFLGAALALQAVLVWGLKAIVGRERPWLRLGLPAPIGAPHDGSFPSGHAAGSFCVAAFLMVALHAEWPRSPGYAKIAGTVGGAVALLVALSRVYLGAHFPGDVLAGAILGALVGGGAGQRYARALWNGGPKKATRRPP